MRLENGEDCTALLERFGQMLAQYDGMLIETGGAFGRGKLGGDTYVNKCLEVARRCLAAGGNKVQLMTMLDEISSYYEGETEWKFYDFEMAFLKDMKHRIEEIK